MNMQQAVFIVAGIPGAGKTTVSRLLAERFDRGVHVESDLFQRMIVSGGLWVNEEPAEEAQRQLRLRGRNACLLADSFFEAGFTPVIDDVVIGSRLGEFTRRSPQPAGALRPAHATAGHRPAAGQRAAGEAGLPNMEPSGPGDARRDAARRALARLVGVDGGADGL